MEPEYRLVDSTKVYTFNSLDVVSVNDYITLLTKYNRLLDTFKQVNDELDEAYKYHPLGG